MVIDTAKLATRLTTERRLQLLEIVIIFAPVLLVIIGFRLLGVENPVLKISAIWIANVVMLALIWASLRLRGTGWQTIGLYFGPITVPQAAWLVGKSVLVLVLAGAGFAFGAILMANIVGIPEGADMTNYSYLQGNLPMLLISLLGVYVVSSFGEELVYRGFLITRLQELFGGSGMGAGIAALVLSSVVFGLAHFEWGATGIIQTTFMGAALGGAFFLTKKRLAPLILAHAVMDTALLVQLYLVS